jgi:hypothetical protein
VTKLRTRRGFVVIEAIIALVVIAVTAASLIGSVVNVRHIADLARAREADVSEAHVQLALIGATWGGDEFRKNQGSLPVGRLLRQVTVEADGTYQVSFSLQKSGKPVLSTVFAPNSSRGIP